MKKPSATQACPCGSGLALSACCGPLLEGSAVAPTAEALMRSRYAAHALDREAYLLDTWHASTRPPELESQAPPRPRWIGLTILRHQRLDDTHAVVEFVARYRLGGRAHRLHETSRFVLEGQRWYYVDGDLHE